MRGKGYDVVSRLCRVRITPACAGKRDKTGWTTTCPRDHPRMCGEKVAMVTTAVSTPGSPPHVRGKELRVETCFADNGITPACAGKSNLFVFRRIEPKDHPRVCGEKLYTPCVIAPNVGSPPRMRGKGCNLARGVRPDRITPAYAGKSEYRSFFPARPWDHPRVCGEKNGNYDTQACGGGSPPRMRGKGGLGQNARFKARITPAYAGKRHSPCMRGTCPRDHPRVCGEKG